MPQGEEATLPGFPKLTLRADRAPNATGAEALGFDRVDRVPEPAPGILAVLDSPLDDVPVEWRADSAFFLYIGSRVTPAARAADAILPVTTFAEMDGTFTNFEGRVQRFHQALQPPGVARPPWMVLSRLASRVARQVAAETADAAPEIASSIEQAFAEMSASEAAFQGLSWSGLGLKGASARVLAGTAGAT